MNRLFALSLCGAAALLTPALTNAQQLYPVNTSPTTYEPLGSGATTAPLTSSSHDDVAVDISMPFSFEFFGVTYNSIKASTNGYATFGSDGTDFSRDPIPSTIDPNALIAVWWDDQECDPTDNRHIKHQVMGQPGARELVIEWHCNDLGDLDYDFQAQLWLAEGSTVVRVVYGSHGNMTGTAADDVTVGIENADGTDGVYGLPCEDACTPADFPTNTEIRYGMTVEPDLIAQVMLGAMDASGGNITFPVTTRLRNIGMTDATGGTYDLYLSDDAILDPATDLALGQHTTGIDVPGNNSFVDTVVNVSTARPPNGQYWVCAEVDPQNAVAEGNEGNNRACAAPFLIGSDLFGSITMPDTGAPGEYVPFDINITNQGSDATGAFHYEIFMSADDVLDGYDTSVYRGRLSLQGTDSFDGTVSGFIPASISGNQFYAFLVIDEANVVTEAIESNNESISPHQIVLIKPDLKISEEIIINTPGNDGCYFGEPMEVSYEVCNVGGGNAWGFVDSILLSENYTISLPNGGAGDPEVDTSPMACPGGTDLECEGPGGPGICHLGICHNPCQTDADCSDGLVCDVDRDLPNRMSCQNHLGPEDGENCKTFTRSFVIPTMNTVTGLPFEEKPEGDRYWLGIITDSTTTVNEENEANNRTRYIEELNCRYPSSDFLAVSAVPPARVAAGETAAVFRKIANVGNVAATANYRYVLSTNDTISLNDIPLVIEATGGDGEVSLERSADDSLTDLVRIPANVSPGEYYLGLVIDGANQVRELDEANNTFVTAGKLLVESSALRVVTTYLPEATVGAYYGRQLVAAGGTEDYRWSAETLPPGFSLSADGYLSGTPVDEGTYVFEVQVGSGDLSAPAMLALRVNRPMGALSISTRSLPPAVVGQEYFARIAASGGSPAYTCDEAAGQLPSGLTLNDNCTITGRPLAAMADPISFTVEVRDARGNAATLDLSITVVEQADLFITSQRFEEGTAGEPYDGCIAASGGAGSASYDWTIDAATIPHGLVQEQDGSRVCLTGTPLVCGSFTVAVRVEDGQGQSDSAELPMTIVCGRVGLLTKSLEDVMPGDNVDVQLEADAGEGATFRLYGGRLPAGVSLDATGKLSGTVSSDASVGVYNFVVEIKDEEGGYGLDALALNVTPLPKELPPVETDDGGGCSTADEGAAGALPFGVALFGLMAAGIRRRAAALAPVAAFAATLAVAGGAQAHNYNVTGPVQFPYAELNPATATQAPAAQNDDDWSGSADMWGVELPSDFTFRFFGEEFSHVGVSGNGALVPWPSADPGTSANFYVDTSNDDAFPDTLGPQGIIAAWWEDFARDASLSPHPGGLSYVVEGTAPDRVLKIQWKNITPYMCSTSSSLRHHCSDVRSYSLQTWIFEAEADGTADSNILFSYGTPIGPDGTPWGGETTAYTGSVVATAPSASVGMENVAESDGVMVMSCTPDCHFDRDWPEQQAILLGEVVPELIVSQVSGSALNDWAGAGVPMDFTAEVKNVGGDVATDFKVGFYGSTDAILDEGDHYFGESAATASAMAGATATLSHSGTLPVDLEPGSYYIIARADPLDVVDELTKSNNLGVYGPFTIGEPSTDAVVASVSAPTGADIGGTFNMSWVAENLGNKAVTSVPYSVVLSDNDVISSTDRRIGTGAFDLGILTTAEVEVEVNLPADVRPGRYYLGIVIDPDNVVEEIDDLNNVGVSGTSFDAAGGSLEIVTSELPATQVGSNYCAELIAVGGNGDYTWSVGDGSSLPPGLAIIREAPRSSLLCGSPSQMGSYSFTVEVASNGETQSGELSLVVNRSTMPLSIASAQLPTAIFNAPYEAQLLAVGGEAPYTWSVRDGELPLGIELTEKGQILGAAQVDGSFAITVQVEDAKGAAASQALDLQVTSPARLTCVTTQLPTVSVGESLDARLFAAGGTKPYTWSNVESRRVSSGTDAETFVNQAPPGVILSGDGLVSGAATAVGSYLWTVEVEDEARGVDECFIRLDVTYDQGLSVVTQSLADADVGVPYRAQLQASGANGTVRWDLAEGSRLPSGLMLEPSGVISGVLTSDLLEGERSRTFSFVVEARDSQNRSGVAGLSIKLRQAPAVKPEPETGSDDDGGCQAGAAAPGFAGVVLALGFVALRRRR